VKQEPQRYVVRFTEPNGQYTEFPVFAPTERKAVTLAKYEAGRAKIPVLECRVEVR